MELSVAEPFQCLFDEMDPNYTRRYLVWYGGRGCIDGNTLIDIPTGQIKIKYFEGGPIKSFDGDRVIPAYADKPVKYSPEQLYKVTFDDGYSIETTAKHRFLTSSGWQSLHDLSPLEYVSYHLPSNWELSPSVYAEDVVNCFQKLLGFLYCYLMDRHRGDGQLLPEVNTYLDVVQLLSDEQQHNIHALIHEDDQEFLSTNNLLQFLNLLSNFAYFLSEAGESYEALGNYIGEISSELSSGLHQLDQQSRAKICLSEPILRFSRLALSSCNLLNPTQNLQIVSDILAREIDDSSFSNSIGCNRIHLNTKKIVSIEKTEIKEFYDLFVPFYNNYLTSGIVNHNSGKTVTIAKALLVKGMKRPERILCAREFQNSISDSVLKTLEDEIDLMGLRDFYTVQNNAIYGNNGTEFIFKGLRNNIQSIKSMAGVTIVWLEEAQTLSDRSYEVLIPTIRADGSQFLISFNPDNDDDPTYVRFVVNTPEDAFVQLVNYPDNPWFPEVLRKEMEHIRNRDTDLYNHIWMGETRKNNVGSIYGKFINEIEAQITNVPYNPSVPVITGWDLGYGDSTVIWFAQVIGKEPRLIDCYASNMEGLDHYVKVIHEKPYNYSQHILPHDAGHNSLRTGTTLAKQLEGMGLQNIKVLPVDSVETGIQLVRQLLPQLWIDKEKCEKGISALRKYQYEFDDEHKVFKNKPLHNWCSDYADSLRYLATHLATVKSIYKAPVVPDYVYGANEGMNWMAG